jgi:hypothetical protein
MVRTGSAEKVLALQREAKELFAHLENSGEGGEMLCITAVILRTSLVAVRWWIT